MNKSDFSRSRKGDRVYSIRGPECEVGGTNAMISSDWGDRSIGVKLDSGRVEIYRHTGCLLDTDSFPSLFWFRPHIEIPSPPRRTKWVEIEVRPYRLENGKYQVPTDTVGMRSGPIQIIKVEVYDE